MVESFKPGYKGGGGRAGGMGMQPRKIRTERLRRDYGRAASSPRRRDAVGLVETNEESSNSKKRKRKNSGRGEAKK